VVVGVTESQLLPSLVLAAAVKVTGTGELEIASI
jgi:hypothetical protein